MDVPGSADIFLLDGFRFDRRRGCLSRLDRSGVSEPVALGSRALGVLALLVERKGELVSKDEIMAAVWQGRIVEESNLNVQISKLRQILDRNRGEVSCIQTISGRGYCFVGRAILVEPTNADAPSELSEHDAGERQMAASSASRSQKQNRRGFWGVVGAVVTVLILASVGGFYWLPPLSEASRSSVAMRQIALWDAVIAGDLTKASAAMRAGADINGLDTREKVAGPNGRRPLNYAALRNDIAMIEALLDAGAMINLANLSGFTPLHHAAEAGSKEAAILLLAKGADPTLRTARNLSPMEVATAQHHPEIAEMLQREMTPAK